VYLNQAVVHSKVKSEFVVDGQWLKLKHSNDQELAIQSSSKN